MAHSSHIHIIEDEADIYRLIQFHLESGGHSVSISDTGEKGLESIRSTPPDLLLLDLMLPGIHGLDICRILKSDSETQNIPIIILSALGEELDIVKGLELGADDYMTKPFSPKVLVARVKAVLRRGEMSSEVSETIKIHEIAIRHQERIVEVYDEEVDLTHTEYKLLYLLATHPGWVYTRNQIINKVHGDDYPVTDRSVDVQIVGLRKKLGESGQHIKTIRGVGYRFEPEK